MPIKIIRQDITQIECDAIVNPTNIKLRPTGGVDKAIHKAAGKELFRACKSIKRLEVGGAAITPAFDLSCKYVIHTVGPVWHGGDKNERELLKSAYTQSLSLAEEHGCESIAFPLISSGEYKYPKEQVLRVAIEAISEFLTEKEMLVYLVVYDKTSYEVSTKLFSDVTSYVDSRFVEDENVRRIISELDAMSVSRYMPYESAEAREELCFNKEINAYRLQSDEDVTSDFERDIFSSVREKRRMDDSLESRLNNMDKGFAQTLFYYIDKKKMDDVECYKRANVDKKTFSKIKCNKDYRPSKITAVSFAIALHLSLEETTHLLKTAGMTLSRSNKFDIIIEYFISTGNYETIFDVNEVLYQFDQSTLGV